MIHRRLCCRVKLKGKLIVFFLYGTGLCVTTEIIIEFEKGIVNKSTREIEIEQYKICFNFEKKNQQEKKPKQKIIKEIQGKRRELYKRKHTRIKGAREEFLPTVAKIT